MNTKYIKRQRRATKGREHIKKLGYETGIARMSIHRSLQHIYVQILEPTGGKVLATASSVEADLKANLKKSDASGKIGVAKSVGALIAERAKMAGVERVACDRSGYKYHGRVAALVEAARENGLVV
jgi:large subunit ribosomal protein L18